MKKKILVTGSHRSGSTWTGKVIAKAKNVRYVHEPFNIGINRSNSPFKFWFEFLLNSSTDHQNKSKSYINSFFKIFHKNNFKILINERSTRGYYSHFKDLITRINHRTLIKDPIAIMSTEWIYNNYDIDIIVLIRHPAAFVASLKVKNWQYDFNNYLNQPALMSSYLKDYKELIEDFTKNKKDIIDQGILLWITIYDTVDYYRSKYKNEWQFIKHEDLSTNPLSEFKKLFSKVHLDMDINVENYILESTNSKDNSNLKRNSSANIKTWKSRLTPNEIDRIKKGTEKVWTKFYTQEDW